MPTKFILHGGFDPNKKEQENFLFFGEILNTPKEDLKILLVYFAKDESKIESSAKNDIEQFEKCKLNKKLAYEIATEANFITELHSADIIYFRGGSTAKILDTLKKYNDLKMVLEGKIVAADSAGANSLSKIFFSKSLGVCEGLGIVDIKLICHTDESNQDKLDSVTPDLKLVRLKEYQVEVIES